MSWTTDSRSALLSNLGSGLLFSVASVILPITGYLAVLLVQEAYVLSIDNKHIVIVHMHLFTGYIN